MWELERNICIEFGIEPTIHTYCGANCDVEPCAMEYECKECTDFILKQEKIYPRINGRLDIIKECMNIIATIDDYDILFTPLSDGWECSLWIDEDCEFVEDGNTLDECVLRIILSMGSGIINKEKVQKLFI